MSEKVFGPTPEKRSIHNIPLPETRTGHSQDEYQEPIRPGSTRRRNRRKGLSWFVTIAGIMLLVGLYSWLFHSATVTLKPTETQITLQNAVYTASEDGTEGMRFIRPSTFTKTISKFVEGSEEENRQTRASGIITVYNTDTQPKTYIKDTRFRDGNERVYRAFNRFTIPGGNEEEPGSIDVLVYADIPGDTHNSESGSRYVLPALREQQSEDFDLVYAIQKESIDGGFSGTVRVPTEADIDRAERELRERLESELVADFIKQLPANYVVNSDNQLISIGDVSFSEKPNAADGGITIEARSELNAIVFDKAVFDSYIATQNNIPADNTITNIGSLEIAVTDDNFDIATDESFTFSITGQPVFVKEVDTQSVAQVLAGTKESHVNAGLVTGLEAVEIVDTSVSPMWRRSLPSNPEHITIKQD